ncbi:hypothetical protein [Spirosoma aerolatum]|uniref:hypothetical protein n=1 Tax=Spirosoma aerolatum TaxID=1211326 RepID=UPI0009AD8555|nr:hypothetical protein [Spirosoma aerolatum]
MTELEKRVNGMIAYSNSTRNLMLQVRKNALQRAEAGLKREQLQYFIVRCAGLLDEFGLRMGQTIIHNKIMYVLAEIDGTGNPVGHRIKADGSVNPNDKVSLFKSRLMRVELVSPQKTY